MQNKKATIIFLFTLVSWSFPAFANAQSEVIHLGPNTETVFEVADNQTYRFSIDVLQESVNIVTVEQDIVDLYLDINDSNTSVRIDGRNHVLGHEIAIIDNKQAKTVEVTIGIAKKLSRQGRFTIAFIQLTPTVQNRNLIKAYQEIDLAQNHSHSDDDKINHYKNALDQLTASSHKELFGFTQYALARAYSAIEKFDLALEHYAQAATAFSSAMVNNARMLAWSNIRRAGLMIHAGDQSGGFALMEQNVQNIDKEKYPVALSTALTSKMIVHSNRYQINEALAAAQKANDVLPDKGAEYLAASIKYNLAQLNHSLGKTDQAIDSMTEVLALDRHQENRIGATSSLESLGEFYAALGQCSKSINFLAEALETTTENETESQARIFRKIAGCYRNLGQFSEAENLYRKALEISKIDKREIAHALRQLGNLYFNKQDYQAALERHEDALKHYTQFQNPADIGGVEVNIAEDHIALGNQQKAMLAIESARKTFGENLTDIRVGDIEQTLGLYEAKWGEPQDAKRRFQAAVLAYEKSSRTRRQISALTGLSEALAQLGSHTESLSFIDEAIALIEATRATIAQEDYRAAYFAQRRDVFEQKIRVLMSNTNNNQSNVAKAWQAADQLAARSLLDVLQTDEGNLEHIDPALAQRRRGLMSALRQELAALERATTPGLIDTLNQQIQAGRLELDALEQSIASQYPGITGITWQELDTQSVQAQLKPNQGLLQFSVGKHQSYAWFVTHESIDVHLLPNRFELTEKSVEFLKHLKQSRLLNSKIHQELSTLLLASLEIPQNITELLVVPDGPLAYLPMGALKLRDQNLLIDDFAIANIPSASSLLTHRPSGFEPHDVVVFADPVYSKDDLRVDHNENIQDPTQVRTLPLVNGDDFTRLPFSAIEADAFEKFANDVNAMVFEGFDATKTQLLHKDVLQADILHLAAHAVANSKSPQLSGLILSQINNQGQPVDGFVGLQEIYSMGSRASLVVLSACESAIGQEILGEGMISLARGFMRNGSSNVIASQWRVPDKATAQLMSTFYGELLGKSTSLDRALRSAQLEIRSNPKWREPFYWAGFSLWGKVPDKTLVASGHP